MKADVFVPKAKFDEIDKKISCGSIVEKGTCQTFFWQNEEWCATGAMSKGGCQGWKFIEAQRVQELAAYKGELEPLKYGNHFAEVDKGNRARSYEGMRVKQGKRELVFVGPDVRFGLLEPAAPKPEPDLNIGRYGQLKLFFA